MDTLRKFMFVNYICVHVGLNRERERKQEVIDFIQFMQLQS